MEEGTFCTVVNCMDGRVQVPVITWMRQKYGVDYVDMITEAGPIGILSRDQEDGIGSIRNRVEISVEKHGSKVVAVVGHGDCAGNPVPTDEGIEQLRKSMRQVRSWGFDVTVIGLWVDSKDWSVSPVE